MSNIYLVRHGQDEDNLHNILNGHRDLPLTDLGRQQAAIVGQKLRDNNIDVIYSSPLQRAHETATIIADILGIHHVEKELLLIERDFGVLTGKPISDIQKYATRLFQGDKILYFLEVERGEDFPTTYARAEKVLRQMQEQHRHENVLLVTHGDIGKMIRAAYHGWGWQEGLDTPYLDNTGVLELMPAQDIIE